MCRRVSERPVAHAKTCEYFFRQTAQWRQHLFYGAVKGFDNFPRCVDILGDRCALKSARRHKYNSVIAKSTLEQPRQAFFSGRTVHRATNTKLSATSATPAEDLSIIGESDAVETSR